MRRSRRQRAETSTRVWVDAVVRSGLYDEATRHLLVSHVIDNDEPWLPAEETARTWILEAEERWRGDAITWADRTDHDRLQHAFGAIEALGIPVLQGVDDHWHAQQRLDAGPSRGVVWFTVADVWHAIGEPMLEVNLWHPDGANAAAGEPLLDEVLAVLRRHDLDAHFEEGRIEVAVRWQRRPE